MITVLATDGLPTSCTPNDIASVAAIAKAGAAANPVISTFVIGVFGTEDVAKGAPDNLNLIAQQGGTQAAFIVDTQKDVTAQFLAALDTIRGARLACEFKIPQPMSGTDTLDYGSKHAVSGEVDRIRVHGNVIVLENPVWVPYVVLGVGLVALVAGVFVFTRTLRRPPRELVTTG